MDHIAPEDFLHQLDQGLLKEVLILDAREPEEWSYYHLEEPRLMPMQTIPEHLDEIPEDREVYVICAHGVRSEMVCRFLLRQGKKRVINVRGGMAAVSGLRGFQYD
ncbi:rhodanese-like domain-containing protein [Paenibacillus larvae]|nr:rhodanese-like domain-containing protein [Paenibacillus larvae]AQR79406.1 sulfurtransferase [Paenibacillus larvae subsp. larvae]AQT86227.1 sulfurtransferase [Paenibacillus larvae subsp. pulvifaciens]AQZ47854.1 sulfurtransferase [Paenibacillus larvae subsp. pulvifaciens]ARF69612.1 sulfurtransferase [Paenibacillus larvae subsp. pulvifaciens]AVF23416.1 rhodanese-related sulfur transferase-like protein [Paenibacillus larvae subsp. larvae]